MKTYITLLSFVIFGISLFASDETHDHIPELLSDGWKAANASEYDGEELYSYINGGAELFQEYGFSKLDVYHLKKGAAQTGITLEIYEMSDPAASEGLFRMKYGLSVCAFPQSLLCFNSPQQVVFVHNRYYVKIDAAKVTKESVRFMKHFTGSFVKKITSSDSIDFVRLPKEAIVIGSERLLRGPVALQNIYPLGEGKLFWNREPELVLSADYKNLSSGEYSYIIALYGNSNIASEAFRLLIDDLDPYLDIISKKSERLNLIDWNKEYITIELSKSEVIIKTRLKRLSPPGE